MQRFAMTVTSKGQVTLPAEFRRAKQVTVGDQIELLVLDDGRTELKKVEGRLADLRGSVTWRGGRLTDDELAARIAAARRQSEAL